MQLFVQNWFSNAYFHASSFFRYKKTYNEYNRIMRPAWNLARSMLQWMVSILDKKLCFTYLSALLKCFYHQLQALSIQCYWFMHVHGNSNSKNFKTNNKSKRQFVLTVCHWRRFQGLFSIHTWASLRQHNGCLTFIRWHKVGLVPTYGVTGGKLRIYLSIKYIINLEL